MFDTIFFALVGVFFLFFIGVAAYAISKYKKGEINKDGGVGDNMMYHDSDFSDSGGGDFGGGGD